MKFTGKNSKIPAITTIAVVLAVLALLVFGIAPLFTGNMVGTAITPKIIMTDVLPTSNHLATGDVASTTTQYGGAGSDFYPIIGDWNGDGKDTLGVYQFSTATYFLSNSVLPQSADLTFMAGDTRLILTQDMVNNRKIPGDFVGKIIIIPVTPIAGDWTGQKSASGHKIDTVGICKGNSCSLYNNNVNYEVNKQDIVIRFGDLTDIIIIGDWNKDGKDTIGVYRPASGTFWLTNDFVSGNAEIQYQFGKISNTMIPFAGDFNGKGYDTGNLYDSSTGTFYIRNTNVGGYADITTIYGSPNKMPLVGDWLGTGKDSIAVYDQPTGTFFLLNSLGIPSVTSSSTTTGTAQPTPTVTPFNTPSFEILYAVVSLLMVTLLVRRKRE